jgi:DNA-binding transcriptional ArsR family regulator
MAPTKSYRHPDLADVSLSEAMQALADPCRVEIVRTSLEAGGRELACNEIPLTQSKATVSHHFEALREAGVIQTRAEGTKCLSSVRQKEFDKRFPGLLSLVLAEVSA